MMKLRILFLLFLIMLFIGCDTGKQALIFENEMLRIEKISNNTFQHITYLQTDDFGKVACNGLVYRNGKEAIVFDTPSNDEDSKLLINWIESNLNCKVTGVVVNHFHNDCLGGLKEFHRRGITSYANRRTIELAGEVGIDVPQHGFDNILELNVGDKKLYNEYFGEGHTKDNIVSYIPDEKVLFGGCLIKSVGAGKGYLGDANISAWSETVQKVKAKYPQVEVIVPGHGKSGGQELLDFTIQLFENRKE